MENNYNNMKNQLNKIREEKNNIINENDIQKKLTKTLEADKSKLMNELSKTMNSESATSGKQDLMKLNYQDMEIRSLQLLTDRIINAIPFTSLKHIAQEVQEMYNNKLEKEIKKMHMEADLLDKEKQMRVNASRNCDFADLRLAVDEYRREL